MSEQPAVPDIDPDEYIRLVRNASDKDLEAGLRSNRDLILGEIFRRMGEHFRLERAGDLDAVVEWQIKDPDGGEPSRWQLVVGGASCHVEREGDHDPTVTLRVGGIEFLRLITGQASGPQLFLTGKLRIKGNLMLAARLPTLFRLPGEDG